MDFVHMNFSIFSETFDMSVFYHLSQNFKSPKINCLRTKYINPVIF